MNQELKSPISNVFGSLSGQCTIRSWVDRTGPNGFRNVIDQIDVYAIGTMTVAGAAHEGEDVPRLAASIRIKQVDGVVRRSLPGDLARIFAYAALGADRVVEHPDVAIAAGATYKQCWQFPFALPWIHTGIDFSLPAEEFKEIVIDLNTLASAATGATVLSAPSFTFYAVAHVREEHDMRLHCVDEVRYEDFRSTTQGTFGISGLLQDFIVHAAGASGGASLANLTDIRIDGYKEPLLRDPDLLNIYRVKRRAGNNLSTAQAGELRSDPFLLGAAPKAVAFLLHDPETSAWSGRLFDRDLKVDMTNTVASPRAIIREVTPLSEAARNRAMAFYGKKPTDFRVATASKSMRNIEAWPPKLRPFLPLKADLPKAA